MSPSTPEIKTKPSHDALTKKPSIRALSLLVLVIVTVGVISVIGYTFYLYRFPHLIIQWFFRDDWSGALIIIPLVVMLASLGTRKTSPPIEAKEDKAESLEAIASSNARARIVGSCLFEC